MKCPGCGTEGEGRFCGVCGTPLESRSCSACRSPVPAGHRYCSDCGADQSPGLATAPAGSPTSPDRRKWWILGAAVVGGLLFLSVPYVWTSWAEGGDAPRIPMGAPRNVPAPGPAPGVDLSTMTPREAADRLFNRVMAGMTAGDRAEVDAFLPMAIDAYRLVPDLDADGHFHLSLLHQAAGDHRAGLETAERVLASQPNHLLALYAAGEAARELGETDRARGHYLRVLEVFDTEIDRDLAEYREHASFLPAVREAAEDFLTGPGP